jgi:hypothetical protein
MQIRIKATTRTRAKTEITTITIAAIIIREDTIIITQDGRRKNEH